MISDVYTVTIHDPFHAYDATKILSVIVIAFDKDGNVLAIDKGYGFDFPRGQVDWDDDSYKDTAKREAQESAYANLAAPVLAAVLEVITQNGTQSTSYMLAVAAKMKSLEDFKRSKAIKRRALMSRDKFIAQWGFGKPDDVLKLLDMAEAALADSRSS